MNTNAVLSTHTMDIVSDNPLINNKPLRQCVELALNNYFNSLEGYDPINLHELVIREIEVPLFRTTMQRAKGNQSRASLLLGISRSTLRKKLQEYNILSEKDTDPSEEEADPSGKGNE